MNTQPLKDFRILELGAYIAAPYASSLLGALGAEVVKVEKPAGDDFRRKDNDRSPYFIQYNAGKRSLAVDLKAPEGVALVRALIPRFDVLVENFRPGKLNAMGLGPEDCARLRSDLVYASLTGFGAGGPLELRPAYDTIGQAFGGLYSILSDQGSAELSGTVMGDLISGIMTAMGVLAGLIGRSRSGEGQLIETSLMEAVSALTIDAMTQSFESGEDPSRQSRHPQAQNFCLKPASGEEIAVHLSSSEKFWARFVKALDRPDLADDPRFSVYRARETNYFELVAVVEAEFATRSADEWEQRLLAHDVPFGPVLTMSGYRNHPQTEWLEIIEPPVDGVSLVRPPWRFDGQRPERGGVTPRIGSDTRAIAAEVYDNARIDALIEQGVLFADEPTISATEPMKDAIAGF